MNSIKSQKIEKFLEDLSSSSPTPGGGAVAALSGAVAASLAVMVANLTLGKRGYERIQREVKKIKGEGLTYQKQLLKLADLDVKAFDSVMAAYRSRDKAKIRKSLKRAIDVPSKVAHLSEKVGKLAERLARIGNKNAVSDAKSAMVLARASRNAAGENIKINKKALARLN